MHSDVSPGGELVLLCERQLGRTFKSAKGAGLLGISLVAVGMFTYLMARMAEGHAASATDRAGIASFWFKDPAVAEKFSLAPTVLGLMFVGGTVVLPGLVLFLAYDLFSGEGHLRTLRYFTGRCRRWTFLLGRLVGLMASVAGITLALTVMTVGVVLATHSSGLVESLRWGALFWVIGLLPLLAWCAISTLVAALFPQSSHSLVAALGIYFTLWLIQIWPYVREVTHEGSAYLFPGTYIQALLSPDPSHVLIAIVALLALTAAATGASLYVFEKAEV